MPSICEKYRVHGEDAVTMTLSVGNAQIGGFSTYLDGRKIEPEKRTETMALYDLGKGNELRFTDLNSQVFVTDVNPSSNLTDVTIVIRQGRRTTTYAMDAQAATGGTVDYAISIWFE